MDYLVVAKSWTSVELSDTLLDVQSDRWVEVSSAEKSILSAWTLVNEPLPTSSFLVQAFVDDFHVAIVDVESLGFLRLSLRYDAGP